MQQSTITSQDLRVLVKQSVHEALRDEFLKFWALLAPFVSPREQKEIERLYGVPSRKVARSSLMKI